MGKKEIEILKTRKERGREATTTEIEHDDDEDDKEQHHKQGIVTKRWEGRRRGWRQIVRKPRIKENERG